MKEFIHEFRKTGKKVESLEELLTKENFKKLNYIIKKEKLIYKGSDWEMQVKLLIKLPYIKEKGFLEIKFQKGKIKVIFKNHNNKKIWYQNYYSNNAFKQFITNYKSYKLLFKKILKLKEKTFKLYLIDGKLYKTLKSKKELEEIFKTNKISKLKTSQIKVC